jgi:hypothetical protein
MIRRIANPIAVRRYTVAGEPGREVVLTVYGHMDPRLFDPQVAPGSGATP